VFEVARVDAASDPPERLLLVGGEQPMVSRRVEELLEPFVVTHGASVAHAKICKVFVPKNLPCKKAKGPP
jgi:hypothetical protein